MIKLEEKLLGLLASKWNFYIKDYRSDYLNTNKYIAITENDQYAYAVIVCDEKSANVNYNEAKEALKNKFNKPLIINVVIAVKDDYNNIENLEGFNKIIYSIKQNGVVYSDEGCKPLLPMLNYIAKEKATKNKRKSQFTLTYSIIFINIIIFILTCYLSNSIYNIDSRVLVALGAKVNELINDGQVWRLVSCTFLHGGLMHIFFNMYSLYIIGSEVEYVYGKSKYLIIYIIAGLGGSLFSYLFSPYSISVGASGAIFGLLGAMLAFGVKNRNKIGKQYMINILQVIGINIFIGLTISNIDNAAHMGGLILGALVASVFKNNDKI